jgi:cell division transport system permease protein
VLRETGGNLVRNIVMTVAAVVTMTVSLTALGGILITRQAINKATVEWQGGVQLAIFMEPQASTSEIQAVRHELDGMLGQEVKSYRWVDKKEAYQQFKEMFSGEPTLVKVMTASQMPPSFAVVPTKAQNVNQLANEFSNQPGVHNVSYPQQAIRQMLAHFSELKYVAGGVAVGVMLGAIALIVNTIQLAIFARRREVAVMKLVGATNWFIRVPFMLEGLVDGLVGACAAFTITYFSRNAIASFVGSDSLTTGVKLYVSPHEAVLTGIFIVVAGVLVGSLGSGFAVRRFLTV